MIYIQKNENENDFQTRLLNKDENSALAWCLQSLVCIAFLQFLCIEFFFV